MEILTSPRTSPGTDLFYAAREKRKLARQSDNLLAKFLKSLCPTYIPPPFLSGMPTRERHHGADSCRFFFWRQGEQLEDAGAGRVNLGKNSGNFNVLVE